MQTKRQDNDPPMATAEWGWCYHYIGIPMRKPIKGETYLPENKFFVGRFSTSPYGIEWMRFESDSPIHELIKKVPHIAFEVDDLDLELSRNDFKIITHPTFSAHGIKVALIEHNGASVELIEFLTTKRL